MALSWSQIHLVAAREAMRAHRELDIDTSRRIDPFAALERARVVVLRRQLDHLAGLYVPGSVSEGRPDGVLINAAHPLPKQRYTAAHELAHHRRDHGQVLVLDDDTDLAWAARTSIPRSDKERFAEAFAAWFLMPKKLVQQTLSTLDLELAKLDGRGAYALALELGASFEATIRHLSDMQMISNVHRDQLLGLQPRSIKQELGASDATADAWKDIWLVGPSRSQQQIYPSEGDVLIFELPEVPSSGYLWRASRVPAWLSFVRDEYHAPQEEFVGGHGKHRFLFRVDGTGHEQVHLDMERPWHPAIPVETLRVDVIAQPKPLPGLVEPERLAASAG